MKNISALFVSSLVFFVAGSAFACGPSFDTPGEMGLLALIISFVPMTLYSVLSAIYLLFTRNHHNFGFKRTAWVWAKASALSYLVSMTAIFAASVVDKSFNLPSNLMITFVATAPLVALTAYFTRVYYAANKNVSEI